MKLKPELSIVIITLNEEEYLPKLLKSIEEQTFKNLEIIVADYNSTDKTRKIARSFKCRITKGGNYSAGRNNVAKRARADYLFFLDADSILPKKFLKVNFREFKKSEKGTGTVPVEPLSNKYFDKIFFKAYDYWSILMSRVSPHCAGCGIFARKDIFNKIKGFNENIAFAENHDFVRRARRYGFIILPVPIYTSVRRMDSEGRAKFVLKYIYSGLYRLLYKEIGKEIFQYRARK